MTLIQAILMILLTVVMYFSAKSYNKNMIILFEPSVSGSVGVIIVLLLTHQNYHDYMTGGKWINHLLNATVVCLAYPLIRIDIKSLRI